MPANPQGTVDTPKGRTREVAANTFYAEFGIDYTDGYRVTVGWSEEDGAWIARVAGCAHDGACLADGPTKEAALLSLICSMATLVDAVEDDRAKAVASLALARRDGERLQRENEEMTGVIETFGRVSFLPDPDRDELELRYRVAGLVFRAGGMAVFGHAIRACAERWEEKLRAIRLANRSSAEKMADAFADVERAARKSASPPPETTQEEHNEQS